MSFKEFTRRIPIKAPAKAIYEAWSTQQGLESWFLRLAQFTNSNDAVRNKQEQIQPGDKYKWRWHGYEDHVEELNTILEANGWDQLKFKFSGECIVTVSIIQQQGENICQLVQFMPMDDEKQQQFYFTDCGNGWTFYLANLKS